MDMGRNETSVIVFILQGISAQPEMQVIFFVLFLGIYIMTLTWNLGLVILIRSDPQLHSPMYFFLRFLSFLIDICYSSSITPRMLSDFFLEEKIISFLACAAQYFFAAWMALTECCLLAIMAYDRYVAIYSPLRYSTIMHLPICVKLVAGAYIAGCLGSLVQTTAGFHLHFCGPNIINHFFCDIPQIIALSCSNPFINQIMMFLVALCIGLFSFLFIIMSYVYITVTILKMPSAKGRAKAFNTCASHLTAVTLFFGTSFCVYLHPNTGHSQHLDKLLSIFYTILIPVLNPLIYSLRNKEIKDALKRLMKKGNFPNNYASSCLCYN
ncbi:LOW QUALITY PROTEIN: olfactory receptor 5A1-like [Gracilinanus agilis]|uniref:LOW QUALITY PROTEIN: olfactory receptor 5A1-like n=1 Tax=Gracilinanus agilis TaxID=191870 RepID=UPI001CFD6897|nr:LOW QUALITY PROTEIN: olfactory receptor 5A1-like [Gracilinanus agilis]